MRVGLLHLRTWSVRRCRSALIPLILSALVFVDAACGTLPRDPEGTSKRVQRYHEVRVGLVSNPPWVVAAGGEPSGVEVKLIRELASSLGAKPKWFWGSEQTHMEALEQFELDLVLSGLDASTPWSKHVSLTKPYFTEEIAIGVPPGTRVPDALHGLKVSVQEGDATAAYLRRKGAIAVRTEDIGHMTGPVAAPAWLLDRRGFTRTQFTLSEKKHVIAAPPGENAWLKRLQEYLEQQKPKIKALLAREAHP
jgi:polar amino acid transport system substrate-binding protein